MIASVRLHLALIRNHLSGLYHHVERERLVSRRRQLDAVRPASERQRLRRAVEVRTVVRSVVRSIVGTVVRPIVVVAAIAVVVVVRSNVGARNGATLYTWRRSFDTRRLSLDARRLRLDARSLFDAALTVVPP